MKFYSYRETKPHSTGSLPVAYYNVDEHHPRYQMIHHWHKEYEIVFVNSGWLELTLNADTFFLKAGDIALINPGVIHSAIPKAAKYECLLFDLDITLKGHLARYPHGKALLSRERVIPVFIFQKNSICKNQADKLLRAMSKEFPGFELEAFSCISAIFAEIISKDLSQKASEKSLKFAARLLPFENAVSFIEKNYTSAISLEEIALAAGMSRKYFSEYFKKVSGRGPIEFLNCYRIERASEMLMHTDLPVTEIALDCGFNDLSYFIKTFKAQKSITPAKYRSDA